MRLLIAQWKRTTVKFTQNPNICANPGLLVPGFFHFIGRICYILLVSGLSYGKQNRQMLIARCG